MEMKKFMTRDNQIDSVLIEKQPRIGEWNYNNNGSYMQIVNYTYYTNIDVVIISILPNNQIMYYLKQNCTYNNFKNGGIRSPYEKTIRNIGYIGEGIYGYNSHPVYYTHWYNMIHRCSCDENRSKRNMSYINVDIDPLFYNFQFFAHWCDLNYYEAEGEQMCLDKDILFKDNKTYSPETCCFVPNNINVFFTNHSKDVSSTGVSILPSGNYRSSLSVNNKINHLNVYKSKEDAIMSYKISKEFEIRRLAHIYLYDKGCYKFKPFVDKIYPVLSNYKI